MTKYERIDRENLYIIFEIVTPKGKLWQIEVGPNIGKGGGGIHRTTAEYLIKDEHDFDSAPDGTKILKGLIIENKAGRQAVYGKVTVDCSGDADIAYFAGPPMQYPGSDMSTVMFEIGNVDLQKTYEYYKDHREDLDEECDIAFPFSDFEANWLERGIFHTPHNGGVKNFRITLPKIEWRS